VASRDAGGAPVSGERAVLDLLHARRAAGSRPLERDDGARLALIIEGGGMRGIVSAAMTALLEREGFTEAFDLVVGTSAGALNGAALLAGVADACAEAYATDFASRRFINLARLAVGRPAIDVAWTLDYASAMLDEDRHRRTLSNPIELHCVAVDVDTCAAVDLTGMSTRETLRSALLASSRMPLVGGDPVEHEGRRYIDGGLAEPIPVGPALAAGATHVLVFQTRPEGVPRSSPGGLADRLIARRLRALNPALADLYRARIAEYDRITAAVAARSAAPDSGPPWVDVVRPPRGAPSVSQLERDPGALRAAAGAARLCAEAALGVG
jgi:predicted patatin/cPLA2 family phospholipase